MKKKTNICKNLEHYLAGDKFIHVQHINNSSIKVCCRIVTLFKTGVKKVFIRNNLTLRCSQKKALSEQTVEMKQLSKVGSLTGSYLS